MATRRREERGFVVGNDVAEESSAWKIKSKQGLVPVELCLGYQSNALDELDGLHMFPGNLGGDEGLMILNRYQQLQKDPETSHRSQSVQIFHRCTYSKYSCANTLVDENRELKITIDIQMEREVEDPDSLPSQVQTSPIPEESDEYILQRKSSCPLIPERNPLRKCVSQDIPKVTIPERSPFRNCISQEFSKGNVASNQGPGGDITEKKKSAAALKLKEKIRQKQAEYVPTIATSWRDTWIQSSGYSSPTYLSRLDDSNYDGMEDFKTLEAVNSNKNSFPQSRRSKSSIEATKLKSVKSSNSPKFGSLPCSSNSSTKTLKFLSSRSSNNKISLSSFRSGRDSSDICVPVRQNFRKRSMLFLRTRSEDTDFGSQDICLQSSLKATTFSDDRWILNIASFHCDGCIRDIMRGRKRAAIKRKIFKNIPTATGHGFLEHFAFKMTEEIGFLSSKSGDPLQHYSHGFEFERWLCDTNTSLLQLKHVRLLTTSGTGFSPDSLATVIFIITYNCPQLSSAEIELPVLKINGQNDTMGKRTARKLLHCFEMLERLLPSDTRLKITGLEQYDELRKKWTDDGYRRRWWYGTRGAKWICPWCGHTGCFNIFGECLLKDWRMNEELREAEQWGV